MGRPLGKTLRDGYARQEMEVRSELQKAINGSLAEITGCPGAAMRYSLKEYCRDIYLRHRVKLVGWPCDMVFTNLSQITGHTQISRLAARWKHGRMYFVKVSAGEAAAAAQDPRAAAPGPLHHGIPPYLGRSDLKKRCFRPKTNPLNLPGRYVRDGPKSARWVTAEAEARAEVVACDEELGACRADPFGEETRRFFTFESLHAGGGVHGRELPEDPIEEFSD